MSGGADIDKASVVLNLYVTERLGDCVRAVAFLDDLECPLPLALASYRTAVRQAVGMHLAETFWEDVAKRDASNTEQAVTQDDEAAQATKGAGSCA